MISAPILITISLIALLGYLWLKRRNDFVIPEKIWLLPPNMPKEYYTSKITKDLLERLEKRLKTHRYILNADLEVDHEGHVTVHLLPNHDALQAEAKPSLLTNLRETYRRILIEINNSAQEAYPKVHAFLVWPYDQWNGSPQENKNS